MPRIRRILRPLLAGALLAICGLFPFQIAAEDVSQGNASAPVQNSAAVNHPADPAPANSAVKPVAVNPYDQRLAVFETQYAQASPAEAAVLLGRIYRLRDFVNDPSAIAAFMDRASSDRQQHPLVRDEALRYLALTDIHGNHLEAAEAKLKALGFVREWAIIGPFAGDVSGPEQGFRTDASFTDSLGRRRGWRSAGPMGPQTWMNLADRLPQAAGAVAFAATSIYSEEPQDVALRVSAESPLWLFVNGQQVLADDQGQHTGIGFDQHAVAVQLHAGWNSVVLKLGQPGTDSWRFGVRVSGLEGGGIPLRASWQQEAHPGAAAVPSSKLSKPADLVHMAKAQALAENNSAQALEILGRIEQEHARETAFTYLEAAARRKPTADRWLEVARNCGEGPCRMAALTAALQAEHSSEPARLALANYYFGRNQLEKARNFFQQALELVPNDFVAAIGMADLYASVGLNSVALTQTEKIQKTFPGPLWLKRSLAARYEDLGLLDRALRLLEQVQQQKYDGSEERSLLTRIYQRRKDAQGLRRLYAGAVRINPADTAALAGIANLEATGHFANAQQTMRAALEIAPEKDALRQQYAELLARAGDQAEAQRQLARAVELNPNLESAHRQLRFASGEGQDPDAAYLVNAAEVAAALRRSAAAVRNNAVQLADVRIERVYDNGLSSVHVQQIFYIATEQAAREYSTRTVQYSPESQQLKLLRMRVHKAGGGVVEGEDGGESQVAEANVSMYYDVRSHVVRFPALEKQDVIELEYRLSPASNVNPYGDYFGGLVVFRSAVEEKLQRYVLITPARRRFNIVQERMTPATVTVKGNDRIYQWEAHNQPPLPNEPRGPSVTEIAPYVHVSTFHSWQELGRWYARMIQPQMVLDATLREAAARILSGRQSEREKISAIHEFVLRNTHYVALEFGIYSYKPYAVSQTYARRFGDCKDKASLMIALLRYAGIDANFALVRTRRLGEIDEHAASIAVFNHAVVYVPKYDLWLDGTAEYAGARELPLEDQGATALVVAANGNAALRRIPVTTPEDNYTRRTVRAQVLPNGQIRFAGTAYTRGEDAPGLRREYEVPERQRTSFRDRLAEVFPTVQVEDVRVEGAHDLERDVTVEFRGTVDNFAGRQMLSLASSWMPRTYVQTLAPLATRSQQLLLPAPWTADEELHFQLPAGAALTTIPRDTRLETAFGSASLKYERRGREVVIRTSVQFRKLRITPAEYPAFREFCRQLEQAFRSEVKVTLRGNTKTAEGG
ncbi:MAG: DUF3857 domain-containing protein [Terriglobales bacterium]